MKDVACTDPANHTCSPVAGLPYQTLDESLRYTLLKASYDLRQHSDPGCCYQLFLEYVAQLMPHGAATL